MSDDPEFQLLVLPGDGIGPEIVEQALRVVDWFAGFLGVRFVIEQAVVGGAAIEECGEPISDDVVRKAERARAVLFGAVGGPAWDDRPRATRPEAAILRLRKALDLFANLRPAVNFPEITGASSLRPELVAGFDIMIVRECTSGIYFGEPRGIRVDPAGRRQAVDTQYYTDEEIARVVRAACGIARRRSGRLCSVDKANVMESGQLWRAVASEIGREFPDVELSHMYADNCAMQLLREPKQFDVIVTDNLFGDILSDEAAALSGSLGLLPSASLNMAGDALSANALYEPIHGSAPDIAGRGIANPLACVLSFGLCLEYSLAAPDASALLAQAVRRVLGRGIRTADLAPAGSGPVGGAAMTDAILAELDRLAAGGRQAMQS